MDDRRKYIVPTPEFNDEDVLTLPVAHDARHLELYYNIIYQDRNIFLPDHLRPMCMALTDDAIRKVMLIISPGAGKSSLVEQIYASWELGLDPNNTILSISAGADLPIEFLKSTIDIIENNNNYHTIFPHIAPDPANGWSAQSGIFVKRTIPGDPSPSYAALGWMSTLITGKHAKILLMDDIHDRMNTMTPELLDKVYNFYYDTFIGRQVPTGSKMVITGRRWTENDLYGRLLKEGDWLVMTLASIRDDAELYYDVRIPAGLACVFNDYQKSEKVEDIKVVYGTCEDPKGFYWPGMSGKYDEVAQVKKNKPSIFEIIYQSNPTGVESRLFNEGDFPDFDMPQEMSMGRSYDEVANWLGKMNFDSLIQTWDTAYTANLKNDASVGQTLGLKGCVKDHVSIEPNAPEIPFHYDIYLLDEIRKHLELGDLQQEIIDYYNRWMPSQLLMENSVTGIPIIQQLTAYSIPVIGIVVQHTSKRSRVTDGANSGSAQGWAKQHRIYLSKNATYYLDTINELTTFTGARGKQDDRVDALVQGVNYAIDLGITSRDLPPGWRDNADIDAKLLEWAMPNHPLLNLPHLYANVLNPMYGLCGSCKLYDDKKQWCKLHERNMPRVSTCPMYNPKEEQILSIKY